VVPQAPKTLEEGHPYTDEPLGGDIKTNQVEKRINVQRVKEQKRRREFIYKE
jgi:hypothetical protein